MTCFISWYQTSIHSTWWNSRNRYIWAKHIWFVCCFWALVFSPETDHPQVTSKNKGQCHAAAVKDGQQLLCKYSNPNANTTHTLRQAACWQHQHYPVCDTCPRWLLYVCAFAPVSICNQYPDFHFLDEFRFIDWSI